MYEVACFGVLRRYRVTLLYWFTKQFKQQSAPKGLLRLRLVGTGDSAGISAALCPGRAETADGLAEYRLGPAPVTEI